MEHKTMAFLPKNYEQPTSSGGGSYFKIDKGDNKIRILSEAVTGYVYWTEENGSTKPVRSEHYPKTTPDIRVRDGKADRVKHFWAFTIWNYKTQKIEVAEITQRTIQDAIIGLVEDPDWADVQNFDLKITKTGDALDTVYGVIGSPKHGSPAPEILAALAATPVNLLALYSGDDPFN
jgi:hypothetical protein